MGWFGRFLKGLQAFFCEAMGSFERLGEALGGFIGLDGFVMFWRALALECFWKVLKSLGGLWEAVASA